MFEPNALFDENDTKLTAVKTVEGFENLVQVYGDYVYEEYEERISAKNRTESSNFRINNRGSGTISVVETSYATGGSSVSGTSSCTVARKVGGSSSVGGLSHGPETVRCAVVGTKQTYLNDVSRALLNSNETNLVEDTRVKKYSTLSENCAGTGRGAGTNRGAVNSHRAGTSRGVRASRGTGKSHRAGASHSPRTTSGAEKTSSATGTSSAVGFSSGASVETTLSRSNKLTAYDVSCALLSPYKNVLLQATPVKKRRHRRQPRLAMPPKNYLKKIKKDQKIVKPIKLIMRRRIPAWAADVKHYEKKFGTKPYEPWYEVVNDAEHRTEANFFGKATGLEHKSTIKTSFNEEQDDKIYNQSTELTPYGKAMPNSMLYDSSSFTIPHFDESDSNDAQDAEHSKDAQYSENSEDSNDAEDAENAGTNCGAGNSHRGGTSHGPGTSSGAEKSSSTTGTSSAVRFSSGVSVETTLSRSNQLTAPDVSCALLSPNKNVLLQATPVKKRRHRRHPKLAMPHKNYLKKIKKEDDQKIVKPIKMVIRKGTPPSGRKPDEPWYEVVNDADYCTEPIFFGSSFKISHFDESDPENTQDAEYSEGSEYETALNTADNGLAAMVQAVTATLEPNLASTSPSSSSTTSSRSTSCLALSDTNSDDEKWPNINDLKELTKENMYEALLYINDRTKLLKNFQYNNQYAERLLMANLKDTLKILRFMKTVN